MPFLSFFVNRPGANSQLFTNRSLPQNPGQSNQALFYMGSRKTVMDKQIDN